jgi:hypothetical protein
VEGEEDGVTKQAIVESSSKMILIDELLPKLKEGGHTSSIDNISSPVTAFSKAHDRFLRHRT